jgi:hypothetical protein
MKLLLIARTSSTIGSIVCLYLINLIVYITQYVNERLFKISVFGLLLRNRPQTSILRIL